MGRTWIYSFAGAGVGFVVGFAGVWMVAGAQQPPSDGSVIAFFVGIFLAGCGAIAGAIIGGVADLLKFKEREQARTEAQTRRESESEV